MEVRDLLTQYEFPGDKIPIVKGSAAKALAAGDPNHADAKCIQELMDAVDEYIPVPERPVDQPSSCPWKTCSTLKVAALSPPVVSSAASSRRWKKSSSSASVDREDDRHRHRNVPQAPRRGARR